MELPQEGQTDIEKLPNIQVNEEELHGENEVTRNNVVEGENVVINENKEENIQANTLNELSDANQPIKNSSTLGEVENMHEVPSMNLSDEYSTEKFAHDLLQFIEQGHSLENWQHSSYQDTATDSFPSHMHIETVPISPIEQCVNAEIKSTSESTVTLTVLNASGTDEASHPMSFAFGQPSTQDSNIVDHDYCTYPKSGYASTSTECYHGTVDSSAFMQLEQHEPGMDQEKLQRMKRRKEKNRECSRQFRLKQKTKEETLKTGKIEKVRKLDDLRRSVENLKATLSKVAAQCCSKCPKTRMLLNQYAFVNKENINPDCMKIMK